jgi:hypothetical protein
MIIAMSMLIPTTDLFLARRRVVDLAVITDLEQARKLLAQGWDYQTSYPATISNIPHFVLVKKE